MNLFGPTPSLTLVPSKSSIELSRGHVHRHEKCVHAREKPFECPFPDCFARFSRNDNRWQHYRTHFAPRRTVNTNGSQAKMTKVCETIFFFFWIQIVSIGHAVRYTDFVRFAMQNSNSEKISKRWASVKNQIQGSCPSEQGEYYPLPSNSNERFTLAKYNATLIESHGASVLLQAAQQVV
jgi:uncharacterized Zn-finger protein